VRVHVERDPVLRAATRHRRGFPSLQPRPPSRRRCLQAFAAASAVRRLRVVPVPSGPMGKGEKFQAHPLGKSDIDWVGFCQTMERV
jgi:hypothetical protein